MSASAIQAVKLAHKAREQQKVDLELAIDADVQKLKAIADKCMTKIPDEEGYYSIEIRSADIEYVKKNIVIDRFCIHMETLGFVVPKVKCKKAFMGKESTYLIRFRPSEEAINAAATELAKENALKVVAELDVPSSNSSTLS